MSLNDIADKVIETDVLVMGGGIAGCYAAAKAAGEGLRVIVTEKAHTKRSGSASMGQDHYEPVKNDGITNVDFIKLWEARQHDLLGPGRFVDRNVVYQYIDKSLWVCEESEKLGITMKWDDGKLYFMPQAWFGGPRLMLRVHWQDIKPNLSRAVKKAGVERLLPSCANSQQVLFRSSKSASGFSSNASKSLYDSAPAFTTLVIVV